MEKPKLLIIAGPNESGKTTFTKLLLGHHRSDDCLSINSPGINASRVVRRVLEGGHDVPIRKIIKRFFSSMQMCVYAAAIADRLYANDNSIDGSPPQLLFRTREGKLYKKYPGLNKHDWAKEILKQLRGHGV